MNNIENTNELNNNESNTNVTSLIKQMRTSKDKIPKRVPAEDINIPPTHRQEDDTNIPPTRRRHKRINVQKAVKPQKRKPQIPRTIECNCGGAHPTYKSEQPVYNYVKHRIQLCNGAILTSKVRGTQKWGSGQLWPAKYFRYTNGRGNGIEPSHITQFPRRPTPLPNLLSK
jgi:hypothetical protein